MTVLKRDGKSLNTIRLDQFELPVFEKPVDKRGYMYIVKDEAYPEFIKIGRTNDLKKRLVAYNSDKPYNSASYHAVSGPYVDVVETEAMILEKLYEVIQPSTFRKEWFAIGHKSTLEEWIKVAEGSQPMADQNIPSTQQPKEQICEK